VLRGLLALSVATVIPADGAQADIWIDHDLSDPDLVFVNRRYGMRILDADSQFVASRGAYYGPPVPYAKIPKHLISALITQEDRRFYEHHGIDFIALLRAAKEDLTSFSLKQGGSTITQQVLKDVFSGPGCH
jgi:membrane carboxypeptidase/penicillin-binding protein